MLQTATLYLTTAATFLILDALMLRGVIAPAFRAHLGDALLAEPRMIAAGLFYLTYVAGLLVLVSVPALDAGAPMRALWQGAVLGFVAYGTYEMTNYATLRDWHPSMVALDWAWGTVLTGVSAWAGVTATRAIL